VILKRSVHGQFGVRRKNDGEKRRWGETAKKQTKPEFFKRSAPQGHAVAALQMKCSSSVALLKRSVHGQFGVRRGKESVTGRWGEAAKKRIKPEFFKRSALQMKCSSSEALLKRSDPR
jgi:hypothetical protein